MLFATYQRAETIEKLDEESIKPYTIWAVPAENLEDLFLSSFCCAPNRMEALIFFECENYIRIDKVKWYQAIKDHPNGGINPKDYISNDSDDLHSEFLVETIELENIKILRAQFGFLGKVHSTHCHPPLARLSKKAFVMLRNSSIKDYHQLRE